MWWAVSAATANADQTKEMKSKGIKMLCAIMIGFLLIMIFSYIDENNQTIPSIKGVISDIDENYFILSINGNDSSYFHNHIKIFTDLDDTVHNIGDEVEVFYDGNIIESTPAQIDKVYGIIGT